METIAQNLLIVDDDSTALMLHEMTIQRSKLNVNVTGMQNVERALDYLSETNGHWPEIILLDINMPILSGWEFYDRIEHQFKLQEKPTMVCMLSSSIDPRDVEEYSRRERINFFLQKPLDIDRLEMVMNEYRIQSTLRNAS